MTSGTGALLRAIVATALCLTATAQAAGPHPGWVSALKPKGTPGPELVLAADGKTDYVILIPADPTTRDQRASAELATYLNKMTGATFPVLREGAGQHEKVISVGRTRRMNKANLPQGRVELGDEGIAIAANAQDLFLFGGRVRGPIYAVYALLEEDLGCRWYTSFHEVIPRAPTLRFRPVPRVFVPALELRDPFYSAAANQDWALRNRTVSRMFEGLIDARFGGYPKPVPQHSHTYNALVPPSKYFDDHPEYFAMDEKGKRRPRQLCLTNPDVLNIVLREGLRLLAEDPEARVFEVSPNDWRGWCLCPKCRTVDKALATDEDYGYAYPNHTGTLISFINKVADAIGEKHPDAVVSTLAYLATLRPTKHLSPRPNVRIWLCTTMHWGTPNRFITESNNQTKVIQGWNRLGAKLMIWHYTARFEPGHSELMLNLPVIGQDVRYLVGNGAKGIFLQGLHNTTLGVDREWLRAWVWAKQLWNPDLNTRRLIRDFNYGLYGPAAEAIQAHDDLLWRTWERLHPQAAFQHASDHTALYDPWFVGQAMAHLDRAEALAGEDQKLRSWVRLRKVPLWIAMAKMGPINGTAGYVQMLDDMEHFIKRVYAVPFFDSVSRASVDDLRRWRQLARFDPADIAFVDVPEAPDVTWRYRPDPAGVGDKEKWFSTSFDDKKWPRLNQRSVGEIDPQGLARVTGTVWFRSRFTVPDHVESRKHLWLLFSAERLNPHAEMSVYLDGKLIHEQTAAAKKRPLLPMDFPFNVDVKKLAAPGRTMDLAVKVRYLRPNPRRSFHPVALISTNIDPHNATQGGLIAFAGAIQAQRR